MGIYISIPTAVRQFIDGSMTDLLGTDVFGVECVLSMPPSPVYCNNCFTGDSIVIAEHGPKKIKDVLLGEYVYNNNGLRKVEGIFSALYDGPLYNFKVWGNSDNWWCTEDHKFPVIRRIRDKFSLKQWKTKDFEKEDFVIEKVAAKDIKEGDGLLVNHKYNFSSQDLQIIDTVWGKLTIDNDLLYLIGWWLAEGHIHHHREFTFTLSLDEYDVAQKLSKIVFEKFGLYTKIKFSKHANKIDVKFYAVWLESFFTQFEIGAINKKISSYLFNNLSLQQLKKIVDAYQCGDGHKKNSVRGIVTISEILANQVYIILSNLDMFPSIRYKYPPSFQNSSNKPQRVVEWSLNNSRIKPNLRKTKYGWISIVKEIQVENSKTKVYNLSVENEHNYICNNMLTQNCLPDPIGMKSSNIYITGGPQEFSDGQICPLCQGDYILQVEQTKTIIMTIEWKPERFLDIMRRTVRFPQSTIQSRGFVADLQYVQNCSHMETFLDTSTDHYTFKLKGEPIVPGRLSRKFFYALWERV